MDQRYIHLVCCLLFLLGWGCREVYEPEIDQEELEILVVEGHIEVEEGLSEIKLSYTSPISSGEVFMNSITNADVTIEYQDQAGSMVQIPLWGDQTGRYFFDRYLNSDGEYRLSIDIPEKGKYLSDWIRPQITPPIDSIGYHQGEDDDLEIYLNTKGNENAQYFIWNFEETWIFNTPIISFLKYVKLSETKDTILYRTANEMTNECFLSEKSNKVVIGSSAQYQDHSIHRKEIQQIPYGSEKLGRRYSIVIRQRAISKEAYDFFEILRKNSDDIGGVFSPLPSILGSNIHHVSNKERKAIGFITIGTSIEKRIYIGRHEILNWQVNNPFYTGCEFSTDTVAVIDASASFNNNYRVPVSPITADNDPSRIVAYVGASTKCTDCTLRGQKEKPDFWEY
ncbi:DUF4249 domain-containing protein [Echinicola marina]|uniref:DUF4249 domain-containing protein n=1 Tax=Echinicola marina TaxID=2859768 RepID=UPI001CF6C662|nr:DUF4249 domain-containing protein [Echinicola marina]UCS91934.1 DUF4249 domain-containing protein [Echinicola marina]